MDILESFRHLALIVEHRTFTEAARRAHLSQPALTLSIKRLEQELNAQLLNRGRQGASLTAAGEALLPRARAALANVEEGRRAIEEVLGLRAGEVRIGAGATACTYLLPAALSRFRKRHSGVRFLLRETTSQEALDALHDGELDLAIVSHSSGELWRTDRLILVGAPHQAHVDPNDAPYLTFRKGATTRALFERHFPDVDVVMELGSIAAVKGNVREGIGLALVSESAVVEDVRRGRLVVIEDKRTPIEREFRIVHRGQPLLTPAAAALRKQLLGLA